MGRTSTPNERPASALAQYEEMSFAHLSRVINNAVERLSDTSGSADEEPTASREGLLALCDLLSVKADALKEAPRPATEPPTDDGPEHPGPFMPSYELRSLYNKLERYERRVEEAIERGDTETYIEYIEDELEKVRREEVAPVEEREQREHDKRIEEYRVARQPYLDRLRRWRDEVAEEARKRELEAAREREVRRAYRRVRRTSALRPTGRVPFEILPPGEATEERVRGYYDGLRRRGKLKEFDQERLDKVLALPWEDWRPGTAGEEGYSIFTFAHTEKVLLECPVYGNALYVLNSGEDRLLRMNKQQLRASGEAKRIFHTGDWYGRVQRALGIDPDQVNGV